MKREKGATLSNWTVGTKSFSSRSKMSAISYPTGQNMHVEGGNVQSDTAETRGSRRSSRRTCKALVLGALLTSSNDDAKENEISHTNKRTHNRHDRNNQCISIMQCAHGASTSLHSHNLPRQLRLGLGNPPIPLTRRFTRLFHTPTLKVRHDLTFDTIRDLVLALRLARHLLAGGGYAVRVVEQAAFLGRGVVVLAARVVGDDG